jgi:hypothetical protein
MIIVANQDSYTVLESVVRQTFASVVWTHKIQEKQGDIAAERYHWMEVANIICASLTSAGIIGSIFSDGTALKIITALISFVTIFCGAYFKSFNVQDTITKHRSTGQKLVAIRNQLVTLIADLQMRCIPEETLREEYKSILSALHTVYSEAPATTAKAVEEARKALLVKQDYTFSDAEIDLFLPVELKKGDKE